MHLPISRLLRHLLGRIAYKFCRTCKQSIRFLSFSFQTRASFTRAKLDYDSTQKPVTFDRYNTDTMPALARINRASRIS
jgi:hypothetical protein